jgi:hypothetical protein
MRICEPVPMLPELRAKLSPGSRLPSRSCTVWTGARFAISAAFTRPTTLPRARCRVPPGVPGHHHRVEREGVLNDLEVRGRRLARRNRDLLGRRAESDPLGGEGVGSGWYVRQGEASVVSGQRADAQLAAEDLNGTHRLERTRIDDPTGYRYRSAPRTTRRNVPTITSTL